MGPTLLASLLLLEPGAVDRAQTPAATPTADLVVVVAVPVYQPDGAVAIETVSLPQAGAGLVHVFARQLICDPAVAGSAEPTDAGFGWRVASQIVSRSDTAVVVSVDWRRLWDAGRKTANGPGGTVQLTLHPGARIPLDHIPNTAPRPECRAVGLGLEVRLGRTASAGSVPSTMLPLGATPGGAKPVDAELWWLHRLPSGAEQVVHQVVRIPPAGGKFSFAPTSFTGSRGDVSVELSGAIDRYRAPTGAEFLLLSMTRVVAGAGLPPAGQPGTTSAVIPLPDATEVLSFEMPGARGRVGGGGRGGGAIARSGGGGFASAPPNPAQAGAQATAGLTGGRGGGVAALAGLQVAALLEGHQFALRLRITPVN